MFCVFTGRARQLAPFGDPIFRCTTKDRGERRAKGLRPLESPGVMFWRKPDVLCANRSAMVRVTRLSRAWRAPHCFHALCVLRCSEKQQDLCNHPTSDYKSGWLFFKFQQFLCITCSTIESVEAVQKGGPAKAHRSGFGGERRSNGMTELLPRKAKRRIWSLRRRDGPKSR